MLIGLWSCHKLVNNLINYNTITHIIYSCTNKKWYVIDIMQYKCRCGAHVCLCRSLWHMKDNTYKIANIKDFYLNTVEYTIYIHTLTSYIPKKQCCHTNLDILQSKAALPNKPWHPTVQSSVAKQKLKSYSLKQCCQTNLDILQSKVVLSNKNWHPTV